MKIRKSNKRDIPLMVDVWYNTSIVAHDFISPTYWAKNKQAMANDHLPKSDNYVVVRDALIIAFIALVDNHVAALFVATEHQSQGIGQKLITFAKKKHNKLLLTVYKKNMRAVEFYRDQGFLVTMEQLDQSTDEIEYEMRWQNSIAQESEQS